MMSEREVQRCFGKRHFYNFLLFVYPGARTTYLRVPRTHGQRRRENASKVLHDKLEGCLGRRLEKFVVRPAHRLYQSTTTTTSARHAS